MVSGLGSFRSPDDVTGHSIGVHAGFILHRTSSHDSQVAAAIPDLHAPKFKSGRRWRLAVLENVSLARLVYVAIPEVITVDRESNASTDQISVTCLPGAGEQGDDFRETSGNTSPFHELRVGKGGSLGGN